MLLDEKKPLFYGDLRDRAPCAQRVATRGRLLSHVRTTLPLYLLRPRRAVACRRRSLFERLVNIHPMTKTHRNHLTLSAANRTEQPNVAFALHVHAGQARRSAKRGT